jgi:MFS transporter, DHA1 family, multidrug resistance protein
MASSTVSIRFGEFVTLSATLMAIQAIAIDAMLPALPAISRELLAPDDNRIQWVVYAYVLGLGIGQLLWGPLSDRFGRRRVLISGLSLYGFAALACALTRSFEALLVWRLLNGLAAASAVLVRSVIRDLYSGRAMARVMSLTFIVFMVIPILAPSVGQFILLLWPWRAIFVLFSIFSLVALAWAVIRLPETLPVDRRQTLSPRYMVAAARIALGNRVSLGYTLAVAMAFGSLLAYVAMAPQIFGSTFGRASWMPGMFALCALAMSLASYLNSRRVEQLGMRFISHAALLVYLSGAVLHLCVALEGYERLWTFVSFQALAMGCFGLMVANFGAMAMEPVAAVAGAGASLQGFVTTCGAAIIGGVIGKTFDNTTVPFTVGSVSCGLACLVFVLCAERGRLFDSKAPRQAMSPPGA